MYRRIKTALPSSICSTEFFCDLTEGGSCKDLSHVNLTRIGCPPSSSRIIIEGGCHHPGRKNGL